MMAMFSPSGYLFYALAVLTVCLTRHAASQNPWVPTLNWELNPVTRGKGNYTFVLPERIREKGITYLGSNERLRTKLEQLKNGKPLKITTIGGSITAGQGNVDFYNWPQQFFNYLQDQYGGSSMVVGTNGAVPGTLSQYMTVCYNVHVPNDTDIVFVEYTCNDYAHTSFNSEIRRGFERLIRKMLAYPSKPAVVLVHAYAYMWHPERMFWNNAEAEFNEFALYYNLPAISIKACCYQLMASNVPGFLITDTRNNHQAIKYSYYYYDKIHPDGNTGHRVMAELAMHLIDSVYASLASAPISEEERTAAAAGVPRPMVAGNYESKTDKCFIGSQFQGVVSGQEGFEWNNDSPTRPKFGFIGSQPGHSLRIRVDTVASGGIERDKNVVVELAYLKSYVNMGQASVTCESGCRCEETKIDGHGTEKSSLLNLHKFKVSQAEDCVIKVTVLPSTSSGGHKVKVSGIMISQEGEGVVNWAAVDMVHEATSNPSRSTYNTAG